MSTFQTVTPLTGDSLPIADLSWVNPNQIAFVICQDVNFVLVPANGVPFYAIFDTAADCQAYATSFVASIG